MTSHGLRLVAVVILTMSCIALSAGSYDGATTYSARVLNTSQEECPSDAQRETVVDEVKEDIRNLLLQIHSREYMRIILCCIYMYIGNGEPVGSHARSKLTDPRNFVINFVITAPGASVACSFSVRSYITVGIFTRACCALVTFFR